MLHVHRAARADHLVRALGEVLARPAVDDPFVPEVVAVHSRGIERWLAQELAGQLGAGSGADGICANVVFPFPASVVGWGVSHALDGTAADVHERVRVDDPWQPSRLAWTLLDLVGGDVRTSDLGARLGAFGAHIGGDHGRLRRLGALGHVADLFDRYAVHRPSMVRAWLAGDDVDGRGEPLDATDVWQPALWRAARARLGPSFAERVGEATERLRGLDAVAGLPPRISVFGVTALPSTYVDVLRALAGPLDVHLFLLHPSPALWDRISATVGVDGSSRPLREDDPTDGLTRHPLLTSWGRDSRELQVVLGPDIVDVPVDATTDDPDDLLSRLQDALRSDAAPVGEPVSGPDQRIVLDVGPTGRATDTSLQVHACHGQVRQVEVLRDAILGLMSDDPTLQPRDIVVMCPDVETYAPLVDAVFGADAKVRGDGVVADDRPGLPDIRVRLADRALRQVNPVLRTVADILTLPDARLEASAIVDLAHRGPVRERFGFGDADLDTFQQWVEDLRVRWGMDADHRAAHDLPTDANTWRRAMDRLLVGVAVAEDGPALVRDVLPFDDVEGGAVALAGRVAEFVDRLAHVATTLAEPRPIADWCRDLAGATTLLAATDDADAWQRTQLDRLLDDVLTDAGADDAPAVPVTLPEFRGLLDDRLKGRPSRANHRTGDLTVCTLVPMRSVPFRVVCLLGLDDDVFPRRTVPNGADLIARHPAVGDRDPRTEDRQLLLDAVLSAQDHLVITYRARDERTNAELPPAVPVAELLDVLDATARVEDEGGRTLPARQAVVRDHPLRSADPRTFDQRDPFGFDPIAHAGAVAAGAGPVVPRGFMDDLPGGWTMPDTVEWSDLVRFIVNPIQGYLRDVLGVNLRDDPNANEDQLQLRPGGLEGWDIGTRLLQARLRGDLDDWVRAERARGTLPPAAVGEHWLADLLTQIDDLAEAAGDVPIGQAGAPADVDLVVGGTRIVGAVEDLRDDLILRIDYGRPTPKRCLRLWLSWLVLTAQGQQVDGLVVTRGKAKTKERARLMRVAASDDRDRATSHLAMLLDLYRRGHEAPLLLFENASGAYAGSWAPDDREAACKKAADEWITGWPNQWGDRLDAATQMVLGDLRFEDLLAIPPRADEAGDGWDGRDDSRFGRLALRLWRPVLADVTTEAR